MAPAYVGHPIHLFSVLLILTGPMSTKFFSTGTETPLIIIIAIPITTSTIPRLFIVKYLIKTDFKLSGEPVFYRDLKYCISCSCFWAAFLVLNVPRFLRFLVFGSAFLE